MAVEAEPESLESLLNKATNPAHREEDWDYIVKFCDQVNKELEGPQISVRLLAHKIQSPQEREALFALSTLESCVKHCGRRFHQEIGKFRFLNEVIKVISPKYLGNKTTERVKKKCIEILYSWQQGLPHESKIKEAYSMLKTQGIVKEDPTYVDKSVEPPPPPRPRNASFEDDEKAKLLSKLLKSKSPDDLQAANRLIKNMVKQDAERMEKVSKRINELETIYNNIKVLKDMLQHYEPGVSSDSDKEMMKELYESLEKLRPKLFRLASDTDEKDQDGLNDILKANDEVMRIMALYKRKVEGIDENGEIEGASSPRKDGSSLLDLNFDHSAARNSSASPQSHEVDSDKTRTASSSSATFDEELLALDMTKKSDESGDSSLLLNELDKIFASSQPQNAASMGFPSTNTTSPMFPVANSVAQPPFNAFNQPMGQTVTPGFGMSQPMGNAVQSTSVFSQPMEANPLQAAPVFGQPSLTPTVAAVAPAQQSASAQQSVFSMPAGQAQLTDQQQKAMKDLDVLGETLMQQTLGPEGKQNLVTIPPPAPAKVPMNQMPSKTAVSTSAVPSIPQPQFPTHPPPVASVAGTSPASLSSPGVTKTTELLPLTDVNVPIETIQPGTLPPITAYDKNSIKILIHVAKNRPREDVMVMVVSVMSTNTSPVKSFVFQAAVPKVMKVKLQPPSATDLPAFNPILPPAAITQVMLLANPQKEKIRLKFKLTYFLNDQSCTDTGDVDTIPQQ